jgi:hypothetical protein
MPVALPFFAVLRDALCGADVKRIVQLQYANFAIRILLVQMVMAAENLRLLQT